MVWLAEAYAELSSVSQQIISNPFDCSNGCDLTILYSIIIGSIITIILISVQIQMAREQYTIRNSLAQAKLRNDAYSLLTQMRMLQPIVYEKRKITPQNRRQIEYIVKTVKSLEKDLQQLSPIMNPDEKEKIEQMISRVKRRIKFGSNDFGRFPHRYQDMDFAESILDVGQTLPLFP